MNRRHLLAAAALPALTHWAPARAQAIAGGRPITMLVPLAPGSDTDAVGRLVAEGMAAELKQPVIADNKVGAGGQVAMQAVSSAAPDGATIAVTFQAALVMLPHLRAKPPYDPVRDFTPVARVASTANALVVKTDSPIQSLQDLVARGKAQPDKMSYGSWGIGSGGHLAGEILNIESGMRTVHVPYKGTPESLKALVAGEVDYIFLGYGLATAQSKGGAVRVLAVLGPERSATWPQAPTLSEAGFKFSQDAWFGIVAPPGLPPEVLARLEGAVTKAARQPAVAERLSAMGMTPAPLGSAEFRQLIQRDNESWGRWIARLNLPKS